MKTKLIGVAAVAGLVMLPDLACSRSGENEQVQSVSAPDLSDHPIYSKYEFSEEDNVIEVGIQPLWVPTCIVAEAMRRDVVLQKALAQEGLEIRFHPFLKGADVNFFLRRGDLEAGIGGDMPALTAAAGFNVLVAGLMQQGFCAVVAGRHMPMDELRGKRIAYPFGSNAHYALLRALSSVGVEEADVRLVPLDVDQMPDALADGSIDAFSAWEPTPTIAVTRFSNQVVIHRSLSSGYLYFSRSLAESRPEALRLILASQLRAMQWLRRDPQNLVDASDWAIEAGRRLSGRTPVLTAEDYGKLANRDLLGLSSMPAIPQEDQMADGRLSAEFGFLKKMGKIPAAAPWEDVRSCFDRTIFQEVVSSERKYHLSRYQYGPKGGSQP